MASHRITRRQVLQAAAIVILAGNLTSCSRARAARDAEGKGAQEARILQPIHEYSISFEEDYREEKGEKKDYNPLRFYTHIGTDYGRMGPGERQISWRPGKVCVDLRSAGWAGMSHSLAGVAR